MSRPKLYSFRITIERSAPYLALDGEAPTRDTLQTELRHILADLGTDDVSLEVEEATPESRWWDYDRSDLVWGPAEDVSLQRAREIVRQAGERHYCGACHEWVTASDPEPPGVVCPGCLAIVWSVAP